MPKTYNTLYTMKTKLLFISITLWLGINTSLNASTFVLENNETDEAISNKSNALFKLYPNASQIDVSKDISNAVFLELNFKELESLLKTRPSQLDITLPVSATNHVTLTLHSAKIFTDNFVIRTNKNERIAYTPGVYLQGKVAGYPHSIAGISLFSNSIMASFSYNGDNYTIGIWKDKSNTEKNIYILFKDSDVKFKREFKCGTDDSYDSPQVKSLQIDENNDQVQSNNCIKIYFECDYQMYQDHNSNVTDVTNYVSGFFNITQMIYLNEQINTEISEIYVWTSTDPYTSNATSSAYLNDFTSTRTTFNGNLAHLLTTRNLNLGGVAWLDVICSQSNPHAFSNIENTYQPYPNYSNTVLIVTHELGHNFGSKHTHWCGWPGGPIDNCVPVDDGPCTPGPTPPAGGGTIMSYCHLDFNIGTVLSNGFGPLPGNKIRTQYNAATCLTPCDSPPDAQFSASSPTGCNLPQTINFTDMSTFGTNAWQWDVDGDGIIDYTTQNPSHTYTNAGSYTVTLIAANTNGSDTIVKQSFVSVGTVPTGIVTAISPDTSAVCQGTSLTFSATPINGGNNPSYQWYVNGNTISGETDSVYTTTTLTGQNQVTCQITSNASCASPSTATSTAISISITPTVIPEISISGSSHICAGESVTFSSNIFNGGNNPQYEWRIGATIVDNDTVFSSSTLSNGDMITCTLISNAICATPVSVTSSSIIITVDSVIAPTAAIALSSGTLPTCPGSPITLMASATGGGSNPQYQWQVNGTNVSTGQFYTPMNPADGDLITCILTSSALCVTTATATSNNIAITLISPVIPSVSISTVQGTTQLCDGDSISFTATPVNAGTSPSYQWFQNGFPVSGAQSTTYSPTSFTSGDMFLCEITSSNTCPQTSLSNNLTITIIPLPTVVFVSDIDVCAGDIPQTVFSSNPPGANFNWTNSNTAIGLPASGTGNVPTFTVSNAGAADITSTITVTPETSGCIGTTATYTVTVHPTPEITLSGATLTSSNATSYQWYLDGTPVMGATNQTHTATANGQYSVVVGGSDCPSANVTVTTAGIDENNGTYAFSLYPNPNEGTFSVFIEVRETDTYVLKVTNMLGEVLYNTQIADLSGSYTQKVTLSGLAQGVYLVSLENSHSKQIKKIIIH